MHILAPPTFKQILADFLGDMRHCSRASSTWVLLTRSVHIASFFGEMGIPRSTACEVPGSLPPARPLMVAAESPWLLLPGGAGICSSGFSSAACAASGCCSAVAKPLLPAQPWQAVGNVCWDVPGCLILSIITLGMSMSLDHD